jgi:hypothetical protein
MSNRIPSLLLASLLLTLPTLGLARAADAPRPNRSLESASMEDPDEDVILDAPAVDAPSEDDPLAKAHPAPPVPPGQPYPKLRLSGVLWGVWSVDLSRANPDAPTPNGANRFEVTRTYLDFEADVSPRITLRITPDLALGLGSGGSLDGSRVLRLKFAYVDFRDVAPAFSVRALMQPTPYHGFSDGTWGYRVLGPDYVELFTGIGAADLGVSAFGKVPGGALEYQVLLSNGEGFARTESTDRDAAKYKDVAGRLTLTPFPGAGPVLARLRFTGFGHYGVKESVAGEQAIRARALGLLTWQPPGATLGVGGGWSWDDREADTGLERQEAFLFTSWGWLDLPLRLRAIGRFDLFDPQDEGDVGPGASTRLIAGLAYRATDAVQIIADWQRFDFQRPEQTPEAALGSGLFLHVAANF